ncbi:glycosyltransferase family 4 protein [Thermosulfurimonas sp. F29]|uniref:glycosyltransferase family 4 protein n=1 Tax=Thermosulfurimonas sp. F29 TaxID=2867247 RepID=UPI001C83842B|nr:glycosyltransferase family 4 protein [Thermosulfurimonas sp. F29]MBX6423451.1 glycosyltransferase family 4 protein [Thermosulfurimonas sp. F29]
METDVLRKARFLFLANTDFNLYNFRLPLMKALVSKGAEVWAVAPAGEFSRRFAKHGIHFKSWRINRRTLNPFSGFSAIRELRRICEEVSPDVVHAFTLRPALYAGLALYGTKVRFVASITGLGNLYLEDGIKWRLARRGAEFFLRRAFARAQKVIFQNRDDLEYFVKGGMLSGKKSVLIRGSGVDVRKFCPGMFSSEEIRRFREKEGLPEDAVVVLMVARVIRAKGVFEFAEAAGRLRKSKTVFVLVGDPDPGNPSALTEKELSFLREQGVVLCGFQEDVRPWLAAADIYVLPSYREGLPVSVLEAMACGLPVVTTDVAGCRETVEPGVNGFLVPPRDGRALAEAIGRLVRDPVLRRRMGEASRRKAEEEFSLDKVVQAHLELYNGLLTELS